MFTFFHSYTPEMWEAQEKRGLLGDNYGVRFLQSIDINPETKFNKFAAKNSELYRLLLETKCPFYIDRLQGGVFYEDYEYDPDLLNMYKEMLGDNFLGFQMHEWMSNYRNDIAKIEKNNCEEWTEENIEAAIRAAFPYRHLFLEAMSLKEMAEYGNPKGLVEYLRICEDLYKKRVKQTGGMLVPCDSFFMAPNLEIKLGARALMPEVGAQTPDTRFQIAYARGMAKSYGIPFGTYYEPWGGDPFSTCCYQRQGLNEWCVSRESFPFHANGDGGGSSRSLQKRIHYYSFIAGAQFMSEEWGMCNTFYDWNDYELSPYGIIKYDFLNFTRKYRDIGEIITPIAIVLPKDLPLLDGVRKKEDSFASFHIYGSDADIMANIRSVVSALLSDSSYMIGNESHAMINSRIPDAIDIVHSDCAGLDKYDYLIDLSYDSKFAEKYNGKICRAEDAEKLLREVLPCNVEGNAHWLVNKSKDKYYITIFNNNGIFKSSAGEFTDKSADSIVSVSVKNKRSLKMLEGKAEISCENGIYSIMIPAGEWFFGEF